MSWAVDPDHEKDWIRGPHVAKDGVTPLEHYVAKRRVRAVASAVRAKKTVDVGDYFYAPAKLTVKRGTKITWRWPSPGGDSHDVELLLLDEVTAGVDADTRAEIQRLIRSLGREQRVGAILSSHIFEDVEHACDDVLILRAGQVVFHGPLEGEQLPSLRDLYFSYGGQ